VYFSLVVIKDRDYIKVGFVSVDCDIIFSYSYFVHINCSSIYTEHSVLQSSEILHLFHFSLYNSVYNRAHYTLQLGAVVA